MGQNLVIVESPAKAKTISKYLGKNYTVEASMGHVRDLPKSKLGVDIEENFTPKYITIRGKGELINKLKKAAKKFKTRLIIVVIIFILPSLVNMTIQIFLGSNNSYTNCIYD